MLFFLACQAPERTDPSERVERVETSSPATTEVGPATGLDLDPAVWRIASAPSADYTVAWRVAGDEEGRVPRNRSFDAEIRLFQGGEPLPGANFRVRGSMPDHGHGFVNRPLVREVGDGAYVAEGMLLHMRGFWQVFFDVESGGVGDIVTFELRL